MQNENISCPICKAETGKQTPQKCDNCGWEFVYFLSEPDELVLENNILKMKNARLELKLKDLEKDNFDLNKKNQKLKNKIENIERQIFNLKNQKPKVVEKIVEKVVYVDKPIITEKIVYVDKIVITYLDPKKSADDYNDMGLSHHYKGDYDKAIECYKKAIELDPNYDIARSNLKDLQAQI